MVWQIITFPIRTAFTVGKTAFGLLPTGVKVGMIAVVALLLAIMLYRPKNKAG